MIQSVEIRNFLSHKESLLEFHHGVNIITGKSEHGKSVIMRAIRWAAKNKPSGDAIRSWWGGDTEVVLHTKQGTIGRKKGGSNSYQLNDTVLTGFGQDVPDEVEQLLNMDEINIQTQFEEHFLLSKTAGEVALFFNKIAHLDVIDRGTRNIKKWVRSIEHSVEVNKTIIKQTTEQIEEFEYLAKLEIEVEVLEEQEEQLQKLYQKRSGLKKQMETLQSIALEITELKKITEHELLLNELLKQNKALTSLIDKKETLKELVSKLNNNTRQLTELKKLSICEKQVSNLLALYKQQTELDNKQYQLSSILLKLKDVSLSIKQTTKITSAEQDVVYLLSQSQELKEMSKKEETLEILIDALQGIDKKLVLQRKELTTLETTFEKEFPNICPLCGTNCKTHTDEKASNSSKKESNSRSKK